MKVRRVTISNFRGIRNATILFPEHVLLVGPNNVGKSTVLEALDLVLGPERLSRQSVVNEHDFYLGAYLSPEKTPIPIHIEATLSGLEDEARESSRDN